MDLDETTARSLERMINEYLKYATITSACVAIFEDGRIIVEELALKLEDGRTVGVDVGSLDPTNPGSTAKVMVLEIFNERDPRRPGTIEGWRRADILQDFREELAVALDEPWRPGADALREEDRA